MAFSSLSRFHFVDLPKVFLLTGPSATKQTPYGGTVHLFIGTGHSLCKITFMPFTFDNSSIVIYRGLNSLFIFKSVSFSATTPKLSCWHLRRCVKTFVLSWSSPGVITTWVRRYLLTHYTPEILLNPVFEDLRKPKAPNSSPSQKVPAHTLYSRNIVKSCFWGPS